jgi:prophage tail gpP-like protein
MILQVQNTQYQGFTQISVMSGIDTLSDSFEIRSNNRWIDGGLKAGDECRILDLDGDPILDGYIDKVVPVIGGTITITGRDKAGDLIDSTADGTGEFAGLTLKEIVQHLSEPFSIIVTGDDGTTITRFRYGQDERIADIIRELATRQGYLVNSDGSGDLVIEKAGTSRAPFVLQEGVNIIDGTATIDASMEHSSYRVLGQNYDDNTVNSTFAGRSDRHRPLTSINTGNIQIRDAQTSSEWLGRVMDGMAQSFTVSVADIQSVRPNTLIDCSSPTLGVEGDLLIKNVIWSTNAQGSRTTLKLTNPFSFGLTYTSNTYL